MVRESISIIGSEKGIVLPVLLVNDYTPANVQT